MRQNGNGTITIEDACTWLEETGLCLFLPKRQFSGSLAPSFVEAVAGQRNPTPDQKQIAAAEELLVRLELQGVAVRLNLLGQPGEQPDYVVAAWVLPYVYALRGDRDWRRVPQLTGSRQVSQLAVHAYKRLEQGDSTIAELKILLEKGVTEVAVLRAITELWQQLRIIPVISAPGKAAKWQLLKVRFQKAIAEGASTSQVTAISVLASIYLQAVIAASMEEVEIFLSPLTARSKIREVLRGLVATRQVHTLSLGHAPHFYVAGTLPEFSAVPQIYSSAVSAYLPHYHEQEESFAEPEPAPMVTAEPAERVEAHANGHHREREEAPAKSSQRHFARGGSHGTHRDRKPSPSGSSSTRSPRRPAEGRPATSRSSSSSRPTTSRSSSTSSRTPSGNRWSSGGPAKRSSGSHAPASGGSNGSHAPAKGKTARPGSNGHSSNGHVTNSHSASSHSPARGAKAAPARSGWNSSRPGTGKSASAGTRSATAARKEAPRGGRKPAMAGTKKRG
jgi:hypothetical protein